MQRNCPIDRNEAFRLHMARLLVPGRVPEHRAGLRDAIAGLTEEAAHPPPPAAPTPLTRALTASLTPTQRQKDRLLCDAWDDLAPDQRAALRIADALQTQTAGPMDGAFPGCLLLGLGGTTALCACVLGASSRWSQVMAVISACCYGWMAMAATRSGKRTQETQDAADLKVALALDHPGRYLEALEKLEAAELAGWELLHGEARMERPFSHRRERLYARLGFTRNSA